MSEIEIQKERRELLINHLEFIRDNEPEAFDLENWVASENEDDLIEALGSWKDRFGNGEKLNCGTAACLVGHLPLIFPKEFWWTKNGQTLACVRGPNGGGHDSLMNWFGGSEKSWSKIIYSDQYSDPSIENVIIRVKALHEKLIEEGE